MTGVIGSCHFLCYTIRAAEPLYEVMEMSTLMINLPFAGYTTPTIPLTRELITRGHPITYVNAENFRSSIQQTGADFVPYKHYPAHPTDDKKRSCVFLQYLKPPYLIRIYLIFFLS